MRFVVLERGAPVDEAGLAARAARCGVTVLTREVVRPAETATTVLGGLALDRPSDEGDGPLAAVLLLDAPDLDAVLDVLPDRGTGSFEVRPVAG
ncbi:hypothetical protein [Cellulomonas sp. URHB0016]